MSQTCAIFFPQVASGKHENQNKFVFIAFRCSPMMTTFSLEIGLEIGYLRVLLYKVLGSSKSGKLLSQLHKRPANSLAEKTLKRRQTRG
jgi:hypothetical protein